MLRSTARITDWTIDARSTGVTVTDGSADIRAGLQAAIDFAEAAGGGRCPGVAGAFVNAQGHSGA